MQNNLDLPAGQVEYEIMILLSQAEQLLEDYDKGKAKSTFKDNIHYLMKTSNVISTIIHRIKKDI